MNRHWLIMIAIAVAALSVVISPVQAASLQKVEQSVWTVSGLPSYVNMYIYVPDKLASKPPILVASHHCGGTAASTFSETKSTFVSLADKNGFVMILPEATGHNCWDVGSAKSLKHDGGGDTNAVAQMVRYALTKYDGDASRVYAFGTSSGAMMTEALLGVYPDMFIAGVSVAGVPCGCWAAQYSGDSGANPQWSGPCAGGTVSKTAQEWGDLVRAMFPGYTGHRPRVQLWHGTADTTISYKNLGESIKEWTNLLGLSETPTASDTAKAGYTHQIWKSACGYVTVEAWSQQGAGHDVSWDAASAASFLGLDKSGGPDPESAACPETSGSGGSSGVGGAGSRGASGANGAAGGGVVAGDGSAAAGMTAAVSGGTHAADGGVTATVASDAGSVGMTAHAAGQGSAGVGNATATPSTAAPTNAGSAASSGGCNIVGARGTRPSADFAALLFGAVGLFARRRRQRQRTP